LRHESWTAWIIEKWWNSPHVNGKDPHERIYSAHEAAAATSGTQHFAAGSSIGSTQRRALADFDVDFIFGPGKAKLELAKEIEKIKGQHNRIAAVEACDSLTENQIVAKVKSFHTKKKAD
jgi:hypothetical protein